MILAAELLAAARGGDLFAIRCNNEQPMVRVNSGAGIQHKEGVGASVVGIETMWASYFYRNGEKEGVPRGGFGTRYRCN